MAQSILRRVCDRVILRTARLAPGVPRLENSQSQATMANGRSQRSSSCGRTEICTPIKAARSVAVIPIGARVARDLSTSATDSSSKRSEPNHQKHLSSELSGALMRRMPWRRKPARWLRYCEGHGHRRLSKPPVVTPCRHLDVMSIGPAALLIAESQSRSIHDRRVERIQFGWSRYCPPGRE